jgi:acyl-CoA thioesterase
MLTVFDLDTTVSRQRSEDPARAHFLTEISPDWRAGRGPHGGYLAAILLRALTATVENPGRSPRSLTIHYASSPKPGPAAIDVSVERQGRSLSTLSARLEQDGELMALALAAFSTPWDAPEVDALPMPALPPPDSERRSSPGLFEGAPPFTRQMVMQPRVGATPFMGATVPMEIGGWIGLPEPRPVDAPAVALFCDAWFPPSFIALSAPAVSPTVDLTIHFRRPLIPAERDPDELCLSVFRTRLLHEGFFEEDGVIWGADGSVLAQSRQLGLIIPVRSAPPDDSTHLNLSERTSAP